MRANKFYFSTVMINYDCPFGLPNPYVIVTERLAWDSRQELEMDSDLNRWMQKGGFGELSPNFYQVNGANIDCATITDLLLSKGMTHNPALDSLLVEFFKE